MRPCPELWFSLLVALMSVVNGFHIDMPDNLKQAANLLHQHCVPQSGVDEALITASVNGNLPQDPKLACYIHCLFSTAGLIQQDSGRIRFDEVSHLFPDKHKGMIDTVTEQCQTIHGDDACDTAWKTMRCYFDLDPENTKLI